MINEVNVSIVKYIAQCDKCGMKLWKQTASESSTELFDKVEDVYSLIKEMRWFIKETPNILFCSKCKDDILMDWIVTNVNSGADNR